MRVSKGSPLIALKQFDDRAFRDPVEHAQDHRHLLQIRRVTLGLLLGRLLADGDGINPGDERRLEPEAFGFEGGGHLAERHLHAPITGLDDIRAGGRHDDRDENQNRDPDQFCCGLWTHNALTRLTLTVMTEVATKNDGPFPDRRSRIQFARSNTGCSFLRGAAVAHCNDSPARFLLGNGRGMSGIGMNPPEHTSAFSPTRLRSRRQERPMRDSLEAGPFVSADPAEWRRSSWSNPGISRDRFRNRGTALASRNTSAAGFRSGGFQSGSGWAWSSAQRW